jgi:hypothetical protein
MITDPRAACRDLDPDMFRPRTATGRRRALAVCRHCPIVGECLDAALADPAGAYGRVAGGATGDERAHIAAVRERAALRARSPRVASAYADLWDGHLGESADPARRQAARHMAQDQESVRALGEPRFLAESVKPFGVALRTAVADGDRTGIAHLLRGLPTGHRAALLVAFAQEIADDE